MQPEQSMDCSALDKLYSCCLSCTWKAGKTLNVRWWAGRYLSKVYEGGNIVGCGKVSILCTPNLRSGKTEPERWHLKSKWLILFSNKLKVYLYCRIVVEDPGMPYYFLNISNERTLHLIPLEFNKSRLFSVNKKNENKEYKPRWA